MKTKISLIIFIILICALAACFALGVTGVISFAGEEATDMGADSLVGVLVTKEPLEQLNADGFLQDYTEDIASGGKISPSKGGRFYATLMNDPYTDSETGETVNSKKYEFEGIDGMSFYYAKVTDEYGKSRCSSGTGEISDVNVAFSVTDTGESVSLSGTLYACASGRSEYFYLNPIYQTPTEEVYAVSGTGEHYGQDTVAGRSGGRTLTEQHSVIADGKNKTVSSSIQLDIVYMDAPTEVSIIQRDRNNAIVSMQEYAPTDLPDSLTVDSKTDYIIVETAMKAADGSETVTRELFNSGDNSLNAFSCNEDGICVKHSCSLIWD